MTYTVKAERPLDPTILAVLACLQAVAAELGFSYFLVGATARDVLMTHVFGMDVQRATHDVDFAVALADWPSFEVIENKLLETGDFDAADGRQHLLSRYAEAGNDNRLFEEAFPILEACEFDTSLAGARLLGQDARLMLEDASRQAILDVLGNVAKRGRLIIHMLPDRLASADKATQLLDQFELGIKTPAG